MLTNLEIRIFSVSFYRVGFPTAKVVILHQTTKKFVLIKLKIKNFFFDPFSAHLKPYYIIIVLGIRKRDKTRPRALK